MVTKKSTLDRSFFYSRGGLVIGSGWISLELWVALRGEAFTVARPTL